MVAATTLTTQTANLSRVKYFRIPFYIANLLPNTTYTASIGGVNIGPWCQPNNGPLGGTLISDFLGGKLKMTYIMSIQYGTTFLNSPNVNNGLINNSKQLILTDPLGRASVSYIPVTLKSH